MLVASLCKFYSWSFESVLHMPARAFFAMYRSMNRLKAMENINTCDLQAIGIGSAQYYEKLRNHYVRTLHEFETDSVIENEAPRGALEGDDAKYAVMQVMCALRGKVS
jgi:hypothetical protein